MQLESFSTDDEYDYGYEISEVTHAAEYSETCFQISGAYQQQQQQQQQALFA